MTMSTGWPGGAATLVTGATSPAAFGVTANPGELIEARVRACDPSPTCSAFSAWSGVSAGRVVPQPDLNGYTSTSQVPVLHFGDTLAAGWTGSAPINLPDLSLVDCTTGGSGPHSDPSIGYVIKDVAGVSEIESSNPRSPIVVCPGDWRNGASGRIDISAAGSSRLDAGLIKVICKSPNNRLNPYERLVQKGTTPLVDGFTTQHDWTEECGLPYVSALIDKDNWFWHNVTIHSTAWEQGASLMDLSNTSGHIVDSSWLDCSRRIGSLGAIGGTCWWSGIDISGQDSDDHVVQSSVIGPQAPYFNFETVCLGADQFMQRAVFTNNYTVNCGHNLQIGLGGNINDGQSNILENNDFVHLPNFRLSEEGAFLANWQAAGVRCAANSADCGGYPDPTSINDRLYDASGAEASFFDTNGIRACGQAQISMKKGGELGAENVIVQNRFWGRKAENNLCAGDGVSPFGTAINTSVNPGHTIWRNNIIEGRRPFGLAWTGEPDPDYSGFVLEGNILYMDQIDDSAAFELDDRLHTFWDMECRAPSCSSMSRGVTVIANTFGPLPPGNNLQPDPVAQNGGGWSGFMTWDCNIMYGPNQSANVAGGADNAAIGGNTWPNVSNTLSVSAAGAEMTDYTYWRALRSGAPEQATLQGVKVSDSSPIVAHKCTALANP